MFQNPPKPKEGAALVENTTFLAPNCEKDIPFQLSQSEDQNEDLIFCPGLCDRGDFFEN